MTPAATHMVRNLFITPTTVYAVAVITCWHLKPAHEMPSPMAQERRRTKRDIGVQTMDGTREKSPVTTPAGTRGDPDARTLSAQGPLRARVGRREGRVGLPPAALG